MTDDTPLILLPGLGADGRMFSSIRSSLPQIVTPPWIDPIPGESVADYAQRFAPYVDPGRPCFIGGASFGGVMAQELAAILPDVRACFVIGSTIAHRSKPWHIRILRPITPFIGILPRISPFLVRMLGSWLRPPTRGVLNQLAIANRKFLRWGAGAVLDWRPSPRVADVRICQIHGDRDRIFPVHLTDPDEIIPNAGHLVSITHPAQVSAYLRAKMEQIERETETPNHSPCS